MSAGDVFPVHYSFRLPSGGWVKVTFDATVEADVRERAVYLVRLGARRDVEWPPDEEPRPEVMELIQALVGKRAEVPYEARSGTRLPMKYATLTREMRYFHDS